MGRVCDICGRERPHEAFGGGRGPRSHICNRCMQIPKQKRKLLEAELELAAFLAQTHISDRNISRVRQLSDSPYPQVALLAAGMLEVVSESPTLRRKKGRGSIVVTEELCSEVCVKRGHVSRFKIWELMGPSETSET